jgi:UDP-2-acetamido-2-deoxy-ribo-hexuluronate aminotransferase
MRKIEMVDLKVQFSLIEKEIMERIHAVISTSAFIKGPEVNLLEASLAEALHVEHCISCANGTDALQLSLMALDLNPDDEVIVPAFTYIAPVEAIALLRLKPVFVDVDPETFNIDVSLIEAAITSKTKAIIVVHLYGQCAAMEALVALAKKHKLHVIEDNAQSIMADYLFSNGSSAKAGTIGIIGITSFFPSKNLGAYGDGGALMCNDEKLSKTIRAMANHGQEEKYKHNRIGINSRLDSIQAAILNVKLKYLSKYISNRQKTAELYDEALKGVKGLQLPERSPSSTHVFHQYTIKVEKRNKLQEYLKEQGIASMIYYPLPAHLQPAYSYLNYKEGDFPVAEELCDQVLSLPIHSDSKAEDISYICETIKEFYLHG